MLVAVIISIILFIYFLFFLFLKSPRAQCQPWSPLLLGTGSWLSALLSAEQPPVPREDSRRRGRGCLVALLSHLQSELSAR